MQLRPAGIARCLGPAGGGLHDGVVAAPQPPRAFMPPGAERRVDDAGPALGQFLRGEAAPGQRARPVGLAEHVGGPDQLPEFGVLVLLAQVEPRGQLADTGVQIQQPGIRQPLAGDFQHVRAVLRHGAGAGRPGDDAREVQHADARHRTVAGRQRTRRCLPDLGDFEHGDGADGGGVGMGVPLGMRAHIGSAGAAFVQRGFQRLPLPAGHRALDVGGIVLGAEDAQRGVLQVGEVGMQEHITAVLHPVEAHQRRMLPRRRLAVDAHIAAAAQADRGGRRVDADGLGAPGAQPPQFRGGKAMRGLQRGARGAHAIPCRNHRIIPGDADPVGGAARQTREVEQFVQRGMCRFVPLVHPGFLRSYGAECPGSRPIGKGRARGETVGKIYTVSRSDCFAAANCL